jgi:zinc protease
MTIRIPKQLTTLIIAILMATGLLVAQQQAPANRVQSLALTENVPTDPQVSIGTFPNGMRYYVRNNKKDEKRAQLRLVVRAGSVLEDDDQRGLAHVVEHMAFEGTQHFPKKEVEQFIESLGMRFGADLNAYTSYDETVYMLQVPTDNLDKLDRALLIMEDWAHNVSFEDDAIDKERGIVMEEWRLRRGAGARQNEKIDPIVLKGSRYADRLPIGKPEIIQNFKPDRLKKFYTDWYRPDLMAIIAVGDFDKAAVEDLVKKHFASIPAASSPKPRPYYEVPDHAGTVFAIATDKEADSTTVEIDNVLPGREQKTIGAYRQKIVENLFSGMLSARFSELTRKPDPPFIAAGAGRAGFFGRSCATCPVKESAGLFAQVKDDGIGRGLEALLDEAERVARFGFTATELDRQKQALLRSYERIAVEEVNRNHASRASEYIRNFLDGESLPTAADEYGLMQRFLPQITLDEVNRLARQWFPEGNSDVVISAPEKNGVTVPDEARLAAVIKAAPSKDLKPYVDSVGTATLLDSPPSPGSVVKTSTKEALGITEWELSNGVKVVLKPTTFSEDQIVFRASAPGGTSLAGDADYTPASTAVRVVAAGGLGKFNAIDLQKVMTGKLAGANPFISELEEGVTGNSSRKDLETMFQLIYLRFTQPRSDPTAVRVLAEQTKADMANLPANPDFGFSQVMSATLYNDHLRRRVSTAETVDSWNLDKSMAFYKDRFADAGHFTFVFVGSFDLPTIKPLVERYLGSLPSTHRNETWKDVGARNPTNVVEKKLEKGIEPKGRTAIVFTGPAEWGEIRGAVTMQALAEILSRRLLESIREELGGAYTINASGGIQKIPRPEYSVTIQFGHDPQKTDDLVKRIFQEIEKLKTEGPTEAQLKDEKEAIVKAFESNAKQNAYLLSGISQRYFLGEDPAALWSIPDYARALDAAAIQQAAKLYLNKDRYVMLSLLPEKK